MFVIKCQVHYFLGIVFSTPGHISNKQTIIVTMSKKGFTKIM